MELEESKKAPSCRESVKLRTPEKKARTRRWRGTANLEEAPSRRTALEKARFTGKSEHTPNELKLSDRGWRKQTWSARKAYRQPLFAGARG